MKNQGYFLTCIVPEEFITLLSIASTKKILPCLLDPALAILDS
jgi:hypothetical protein